MAIAVEAVATEEAVIKRKHPLTIKSKREGSTAFPLFLGSSEEGVVTVSESKYT